MKNLLLCCLSLFITTQVFAVERGTCSDVYKLSQEKRTTVGAAGEVTTKVGLIGVVIAFAKGVAATTPGWPTSVVAVSGMPILLPAVGALIVGSTVAIAADLLHTRELKRAVELIEASYLGNERLDQAVARINNRLSEEGAPVANHDVIAEIIKKRNENGTLCPVKRQRRNGAYVYKTYSAHQIESQVFDELLQL